MTSDLHKRHHDDIASLRKLKRGTHRTRLQWIKESPGCASPNTLADLLKRIDFVRAMRLPTAGLDTIHPDMRRRMSATVQVYSVDNLFSDFAVERRRAYVTCYLHERLQALVDLAVEAFDAVALGMYRRSESERDEQVRRSAPAVNEKVKDWSALTVKVNADVTAEKSRVSISTPGSSTLSMTVSLPQPLAN